MSLCSSNNSTCLPDDSQSVSSTLTCISTDVSSNTSSVGTPKTKPYARRAPDDNNSNKYARMARSAELAARTLQSQLIKADERAQTLQRQLTACEQRAKPTEDKLRLCQKQLKEAHKKSRAKTGTERETRKEMEDNMVEKENMEHCKMKYRMGLIRVFALMATNNRRNQARIERYFNELKFRTVVGEDRRSEGGSIGLQVVLNASVHSHQPFNGLTLVRSADACEKRRLVSAST